MSTPTDTQDTSPLDELTPRVLNAWSLTRDRVENALDAFLDAGIHADLSMEPVLDIDVDLTGSSRSAGEVQSRVTDAIRAVVRGRDLATADLSAVLDTIRAGMMSATSADHALNVATRWVNVDLLVADEDD